VKSKNLVFCLNDPEGTPRFCGNDKAENLVFRLDDPEGTPRFRGNDKVVSF